MEQVGAADAAVRRESQRLRIRAGPVHTKAARDGSRVARILEPADVEPFPEAIQIHAQYFPVAAVSDRARLGIDRADGAFADAWRQETWTARTGPGL